MSISESTFRGSVKLASVDKTENFDVSHQGGCLCGKVRFTYRSELGGRLGDATLCHCAQCRRAQGYACAAAPAYASGFEVVQGGDLICEFRSSADKFRAFCQSCGAPLYSRRQSQPLVLRLRLGSLDAVPPDLTIGAHIFCAEEPAWAEAEGAVRYPGLEPQRR